MNNYSHKPKDFLGKEVKIFIDRPLGSKHPKHSFIYEVNYGFVPNTKAPDGEEIDAYVLGVVNPIEKFKGICIAIVHRENDEDDKLVVVPEGVKFSDREIIEMVKFQEKYFKSVILR